MKSNISRPSRIILTIEVSGALQSGIAPGAVRVVLIILGLADCKACIYRNNKTILLSIAVRTTGIIKLYYLLRVLVVVRLFVR